MYSIFYPHNFLYQGILFSTPLCLKTPIDFVRLWLHEASRVYGDKFIETKDNETFIKMKYDVAKASFEVRLFTINLRMC